MTSSKVQVPVHYEIESKAGVHIISPFLWRSFTYPVWIYTLNEGAYLALEATETHRDMHFA